MKFDLAVNNDGVMQVWGNMQLLHCITIILLLKWKKSKQISITIATTQEDDE